MATIRSSLPHVERTAEQPREKKIEPVTVSHIHEVNDSIRLLRLSAVDPSHTIKSVKFLAGQWVDTFIPGLDQAGGFTITSTPGDARGSHVPPPYIELAVQRSNNPPAAWFHRPKEDIIGTKLLVRVGGSFTWPPPRLNVAQIDRVVLLAGGVGVNPLISILSHLLRSRTIPREYHFLYATRAPPSLDPQAILFLPRLMDLVGVADDPKITLRLFLTGTGDEGNIEHGRFPNKTFARRVTDADLVRALDGYGRNAYGPEKGRAGTVCYVCGPAQFTDHFVAFLQSQPGMVDERVLCEKWW